MRSPEFDPKAPKQTISVTLNSDLYARAKQLGINASQVAEQAIAAEYASLRAKGLRAELAAELAAIEKFEQEHGNFVEMVRAHYGEDGGAIGCLRKSSPCGSSDVSFRDRDAV